MAEQITVIIPVKNEEPRIAACLKAVQAQTIEPHEILVVDGHSTDDTVTVSRSLGARVLHEDYGTRAGACQVGIEGALGDVIAFTDADCIPDSRWLEELFLHLSSDTVGVGGRVMNEGELFWQHAIDLALDTPLGSANSIQGRSYLTKRYVRSISGCNSMYRKKELQKAGGFRTDLVTAEDAELNSRLLRQGNLLYVPDAIVHHQHQRGLRDFGRRMFEYGYGRAQARVLSAPVLLSVLVPPLLVLMFLFPLSAPYLLGTYGVLVLGSAIWICIKTRQYRYFIAVSLAFVIEHAAYVAGFWTGILTKLIPRRLTTRGTKETGS